MAVLGNGPAAAEAVVAMRRCGVGGEEIHLFANNSHAPYNPVLGTYLAGSAVPFDRCFPYGTSFYESHGIHAHLGQPVVALDPLERCFETGGGNLYHYDRCLVATGASCVVPNLPGVAGPHVLTMRTLADALALKAALDRGVQRAVVVGASFVGMRVLDVLVAAGCRVVLVDAAPHVLPAAAHPHSAQRLEETLRRSGVELILSAGLEAIEDDGEGARVWLSAGQGPLRGDVVILCMGVRPNLSFLAGLGMPDSAGEPRDAASHGAASHGAASHGAASHGAAPHRPALADAGLLVDEGMATAMPGLFAAGDVAQATNVSSGRREVIPLYANARMQGAVAGARMTGRTITYPGSIPHNVTHVLGDVFFSIGAPGAAQSEVIWDEGNDSLYLGFHRGRLCRVNGIGRPELAGPLRWLITAQASGRRALCLPGATFGGELVWAVLDRAWPGLSAVIKEHTENDWE